MTGHAHLLQRIFSNATCVVNRLKTSILHTQIYLSHKRNGGVAVDRRTAKSGDCGFEPRQGRSWTSQFLQSQKLRRVVLVDIAQDAAIKCKLNKLSAFVAIDVK